MTARLVFVVALLASGVAHAQVSRDAVVARVVEYGWSRQSDPLPPGWTEWWCRGGVDCARAGDRLLLSSAARGVAIEAARTSFADGWDVRVVLSPDHYALDFSFTLGAERVWIRPTGAVYAPVPRRLFTRRGFRRELASYLSSAESFRDRAIARERTELAGYERIVGAADGVWDGHSRCANEPALPIAQRAALIAVERRATERRIALIREHHVAWYRAVRLLLGHDG